MSIAESYRRFCTKRFGLPSEEQIGELEKRIGVAFPDDYRRFLLEFNGGYFSEPEITPSGEGCPLEALMCLYGIGASREEAELASDSCLALFDDNDPPIIVPIGDTAVGGLIILITEAEGKGEILLKEAFGDFHYLAEGIEEFFELLREPAKA